MFSAFWPYILTTGFEEAFVHNSNISSPGLTVGSWYNSPAAATAPPSLDINDEINMSIQSFNTGNNTTLLVDESASGAQGRLHIEEINYESKQSVDSIMRSNSVMRFDIGGIRIGGGGDANRVVEIAGGGNNFIGKVGQASYTLNNSFLFVDATADVANGGKNILEMKAAYVGNSSGATLSYPLICLGDVTKKVSTGQGHDGGTNDTNYDG